MFSFQIKSNCLSTKARVGSFKTLHGAIRTPQFMPVGTAATVKGVSPLQLEKTGAQTILANTYHLHLQPGEDVIHAAGGIHKFMSWNQPILTDSGGYQVFSLGKLNKIDDSGVFFKNPRNGRNIHLSPENSIEIQMALGSDIAMAFDQCPPYPSTENDVEEACRRTHHWLERCVLSHTNSNQALFGIVQGGCFLNQRIKSASIVSSFNLPGIAIGGVSVGESSDAINKIVSEVAPLLPEEIPRYLMGIGTLPEISKAVASGIDLFDCVLPTRLGRHGTALVRGERWNLRNACFKNDYQPLDETCKCEVCRSHSRSYLHHLIRSEELLGLTLISIHNLSHMNRFMQSITRAIEDGCFSEDFTPWQKDAIAHYTW